MENEEDDKNITEINDKIDVVNDNISDICAAKNKKIVEDFLEHASDGIDGFNQPKTWKMKNILAPKHTFDPPAAKLDNNGNLISDLKSLESLYLETYVDRLKPNKIEDDLENLENLKEYLFKLSYTLAKNEKTPDWTFDDLHEALKSFKNKKARDANGHIYELFKFGGNDLKVSILKMFNLIKNQQVYPEIFQISNISSFYKNKGAKNDLNNDRGVFNVVKLEV